MTLSADLQSTAPGALVSLFQLDLRPVGGDILYFSTSLDKQGSPAGYTEVVLDGEAYTFYPILVKGFEKRMDGPAPRPSMSISNVNNLVTQLMRQHGNLIRAKLTRIRTLAQYLDGGLTPDPSQIMQPDVFIVSRKAAHNKISVEFELRSALDLEGTMIPKRVVLRTCSARTRIWDPVAEDFVYDTSVMQCPFTGSDYFDEQDQIVGLPTQERFSKTLACCENRFPGQPLPFHGFPAADKVS